jgi:hypothetical protein
MSRLLLISGSRTLDDSPEASQWARSAVRREIVSMPPGSVVVCGDARGPDTYAAEFATLRGFELCQFCLDGWIQGPPQGPARWATGPVPKRHDPGWRRWPLVRNEFMVRWAATYGQHWSRSCVGLIDSTSPTKGTGHTLAAARRAGLAVREETWPAPRAPAELPRRPQRHS